ncbi:uncharacterized protein PHALS_13021 [Plasmopara halstedii]|uniref:Uncharacterized protein n=1 Tax=Plasmopara halstedii TaxID=4781 RepID=A0A0P1ANL5_PLAHL|nr:uncharacterized protein PHALS_13021 [Plasmopara halstedii]CEG42772.1 hypothetical protein PHALS_13021 [Plasmopara halstedii]|eukprot:XP_024579141.1 hypothetical protein PHALS_13021 [Plasmopara halstedii]
MEVLYSGLQILYMLHQKLATEYCGSQRFIPSGSVPQSSKNGQEGTATSKSRDVLTGMTKLKIVNSCPNVTVLQSQHYRVT